MEFKRILSRLKSQMPLGIGFVGDLDCGPVVAIVPEKSQMPLGIGFVGDSSKRYGGKVPFGVTNASRHWVRGEQFIKTRNRSTQVHSHKCLSALGSWGT